jgi:hypothetical protein
MIQVPVEQSKGIIHYALDDLFVCMAENTEKQFVLTVSYMEIYNELIFDLLADRNRFKAETLTVAEDVKLGFYVKGLAEHRVETMDEIMQFIEKGESNRHYAATAMNHHSSRSHTIFRINVKSIITISTREMMERLQDEGDIEGCDSDSDDTNEVTTEGMLSFVDLAGSERCSNLGEMSNPFDTLIANEATKKPAN